MEECSSEGNDFDQSFQQLLCSQWDDGFNLQYAQMKFAILNFTA